MRPFWGIQIQFGTIAWNSSKKFILHKLSAFSTENLPRLDASNLPWKVEFFGFIPIVMAFSPLRFDKTSNSCLFGCIFRSLPIAIPVFRSETNFPIRVCFNPNDFRKQSLQTHITFLDCLRTKNDISQESLLRRCATSLWCRPFFFLS